MQHGSADDGAAAGSASPASAHERPDKTTATARPRAQRVLHLLPWPRWCAVIALVLFGAAVLRRAFRGSSGLDTSSCWLRGTPWLDCTPHASSAGRPDASSTSGDLYLVGVGKADITGPVVEINLMGYADPKQVGTGLRQRLYSRAFIVGSVSNPLDRFVYLVLDTQSGDTAVRYGILDRLRNELGPAYAALYGHHNIAVTGTHSHSGPGGWLNYLLPQVTSKGFDRQGFRAIVEGATLSIQRAHESLQPGYLDVSSARVQDGSINRSLFAYLANPADERARYNSTDGDDGSVETDLTLLNFRRAADKKSIGVLTWFPTHGTSMLGNNTLITGDNKGVAAYLFEKSVRDGDGAFAADAAVADGSFVAGFSQASVGDTSPNVLGAWCEDGSGLPCSFENSTCSDGKAQACHARGPRFRDDDTGTASCFEIGRRQYEAARTAFFASASAVAVRGGSGVRSFHTFHNMANFSFALPNGTTVETCPAALGYSFAAGTSDGPGAVNFTQHDSDPSNTSPVWKAVSHLLKSPSERQRACHGAKPILLDVGELSTPYQWTPNVADIQVLRVGQFAIVVSPGEASTMAGRRWKQAVADGLAAAAPPQSPQSPPPIVVLGGPANSYTHYITTEEEYAVQRYEGASTLYGPHTLAAYINVTLQYLPYLTASGGGSPALPPPPVGSLPPDNSNRSLSFITGVVYDGTPLFKHFGDVTEDVQEAYGRGARVSATFIGANPRNNLRLEGTFAAVEKLADDGSASWQTVRTDADWSLVYRWRRISGIRATSEVDIEWETEPWAEPGTYRIRYYGDSKSLGGTITPFEGVTRAFVLER